MTPGDVTAAEHSKDLMAADHGGTLALCTQGAEDSVETCRMAQSMLRAIPQFSLNSLLLQLKRPRSAADLLFSGPDKRPDKNVSVFSQHRTPCDCSESILLLDVGSFFASGASASGACMRRQGAHLTTRVACMHAIQLRMRFNCAHACRRPR